MPVTAVTGLLVTIENHVWPHSNAFVFYAETCEYKCQATFLGSRSICRQQSYFQARLFSNKHTYQTVPDRISFNLFSPMGLTIQYHQVLLPMFLFRVYFLNSKFRPISKHVFFSDVSGWFSTVQHSDPTQDKLIFYFSYFVHPRWSISFFSHLNAHPGGWMQQFLVSFMVSFYSGSGLLFRTFFSPTSLEWP